MKILKKVVLIFSTTLLLLLVLLNSCATFKDSDAKIYKAFKKDHKKIKIYRTAYHNKTLRYISNKAIDSNLPTLLFIHGAPGSSDNFYRYLKDNELAKKANLITLDRLGYGYSDYGNSETSIEVQAESIYTIIQKHELKNVIVIGWSYGVPIAAKMAYNYSEIKHSILIAGAISPNDEKFFALAKPLQWKLTKWMFSKAMRVSNDEKITHVAELEKMQDNWQHIKTPILYYHGTKDWIVPYKNLAFIKEKVTDSLLTAKTIQKGNHFIIFKNFEMIKKDILTALEKI